MKIKIFCKAMKRERKNKGWTYDKLAELSGISKSHLWAIENGKSPKVSLETAMRIATTLGVELGAMVNEPLPPKERQNAEDMAFFRDYQSLPFFNRLKIRKITKILHGD